MSDFGEEYTYVYIYGITSTYLKISWMIHYRSVTSVINKTGDGDEEREKQKRKYKFDEDESPDGVIPLVKVVGKEDIGLFFFPQRPRTTTALLHQLKHPSCITRLLLVIGPPDFTKGG
jgi:hypothetical protein